MIGNMFTETGASMSSCVHIPVPRAPSSFMKIARLFSEHPATVGETYTQHMRMATGFGLAMIGGGLACLVHAVLPFTFVTRGSETIAGLYERMVRSRSARAAVAPAHRLDGSAR